MTSDSILKDAVAAVSAQIHASLEAAWLEGYAQGGRDANAKIRALLAGEDEVSTTVNIDNSRTEPVGNGSQVQLVARASSIEAKSSVLDISDRKRAPRGLPKKLIETALGNNNDGISVTSIMDSATTELEKMVAASTIRSELRKGQAAGRYKETNGLWYLVVQTMPGFIPGLNIMGYATDS